MSYPEEEHNDKYNTGDNPCGLCGSVEHAMLRRIAGREHERVWDARVWEYNCPVALHDYEEETRRLAAITVQRAACRRAICPQKFAEFLNYDESRIPQAMKDLGERGQGRSVGGMRLMNQLEPEVRRICQEARENWALFKADRGISMEDDDDGDEDIGMDIDDDGDGDIGEQDNIGSRSKT